MNVESTPRSGCSWARLRAAGDPGGLPGLVGRMLGAVDEESAREACGRIESNVCPNRMLYGAAEAVVAHIVSALGSGGEVSERPDPDPDASARRAGPVRPRLRRRRGHRLTRRRAGPALSPMWRW